MHFRTLRARVATITACTLVLAAASAFGGCGSDAEPTEASTTAGTTSTSTASTGAGGGGGEASGSGGAGGEDVPAPLQKTIAGDMTWQVTFDAAAQELGATDCSYTRHYEGVEDKSAPWLCPACEEMFRADVEMIAGQSDCFTQVSDSDPSPTEWIGYGEGQWWRSPAGPTVALGTATITGTSVATAHTVVGNMAPVGGLMDFGITGALTLGEQEGDPLNGFTPPATYACGWPKSDAPPYAGDYLLKKGAVVPDGLFKDACDETMRLHDLKGAYLLVEMSARDCPPCQQMASEEEQFIADLAAQGITVHVVTLLAPSLADTLGDTTNAMLKSWILKYDLTSPVLADRGWGLSVFGPAIGLETIGYPSWTLVDPELNVMDFNSGFGDFSDFEAAILADAQ